MVFEKAAYWMALGVLALFVSNHFAGRHQNGIRLIAGRSMAVIQQVSGDAAGFLATVGTTPRGEIGIAQTQARLACVQTRLASIQTLMAQREAGMARVQTEHVRMVTMQALRGPVVSSRARVRIAVPQPRDGSI